MKNWLMLLKKKTCHDMSVSVSVSLNLKMSRHTTFPTKGDNIHIKYLNAPTEERIGIDGFVECNPNGPDTMEISHFLPYQMWDLQRIKSYCNMNEIVSCTQNTVFPSMKYIKLEKLSSSRNNPALSSVTTISGIVNYFYKVAICQFVVSKKISQFIAFVHLEDFEKFKAVVMMDFVVSHIPISTLKSKILKLKNKGKARLTSSFALIQRSKRCIQYLNQAQRGLLLKMSVIRLFLI